MYDEVNDFINTRPAELSLSDIYNDMLLRRKTIIGMGLAIVM